MFFLALTKQLNQFTEWILFWDVLLCVSRSQGLEFQIQFNHFKLSELSKCGRFVDTMTHTKSDVNGSSSNNEWIESLMKQVEDRVETEKDLWWQNHNFQLESGKWVQITGSIPVKLKYIWRRWHGIRHVKMGNCQATEWLLYDAAAAPFAFIKIVNAMCYVWLDGLCVNARCANRGRNVPTKCMWYTTHTALIKACFNALNFPLPKIGVPLSTACASSLAQHIFNSRARSLTHSNPLGRLLNRLLLVLCGHGHDGINANKVMTVRPPKKNRERSSANQPMYLHQMGSVCISTREASERKNKKNVMRKICPHFIPFFTLAHKSLSLFLCLCLFLSCARERSSSLWSSSSKYRSCSYFPSFFVHVPISLPVLPMHQF